MKPHQTSKIPLDNIRTLHVELGHLCNIRCIMCYQKNFKTIMNDDIWQEKLVPVYPYPENVIIQGGEPTVIPQSWGFIELVMKHNDKAQFSVMTNGIRFDEKWQNFFVEKGFNVNFSLNAATKNTYDLINKGGNHDKAMANLQSLIQKRDRLTSNLKISISLVLLEENVHELSAFIKMAGELGCDKIHVYFERDNIPQYTRRVEAEFDEVLKLYFQDSRLFDGTIRNTYREYCKAVGVTPVTGDINIENPVAQPETFVCQAPWNSLWVNVNGIVSFCCMRLLELGDLKTESIETIWNGRNARKFRSRIARHDYRYCQPSCGSNPNPFSRYSFHSITHFMRRFRDEYRQSPKVALKKSLKVVRGWIRKQGG